jgi:HD-GYP domain-containing protein (c-di-GMP phosphodiesterase class II)
MTGPAQPVVPADASGEPLDQKMARALVAALHGAVRVTRLYPAEHGAVLKALAEVGQAADRIRLAEGRCALRRVGDYLFVNDLRLRLTVENYAVVAHVLGLMREAGVGGIDVVMAAPARGWLMLVAFLQAPPIALPEAGRLEQLAERLAVADLACFELMPTIDESESSEAPLDAKERTKQTFVRSLDVTRDVMTSVRLGQSVSLKRVKRAVQRIVESILSDTSSMLGLTTLREFDDYTFVHSVNVSILSVALGRRLGLTKPQLLDLGLAALMHDIGKSRLPVDLLNKREGLTDEERALLQTHAWQGVLTLLAMPTAAARPWRSMTAAYEHHMRIDLSGYPAPEYPRRLSLFSRIISVADGFDAATSARVYRSHTWTPAEVLQGMRDNPALGLDQVVVKAFVNLMGIYPIGTLVVLDSQAMAVVVSTSADPSALSRPVVRLISDEVGNRYAEPVFHDLTARDDAGRFLLTIVRTEDPDTHDIIISDYVC